MFRVNRTELRTLACVGEAHVTGARRKRDAKRKPTEHSHTGAETRTREAPRRISTACDGTWQRNSQYIAYCIAYKQGGAIVRVFPSSDRLASLRAAPMSKVTNLLSCDRD